MKISEVIKTLKVLQNKKGDVAFTMLDQDLGLFHCSEHSFYYDEHFKCVYTVASDEDESAE